MQELFRASTLSGFPFSPLFLLPSKSFRLAFPQSGISTASLSFSQLPFWPTVFPFDISSIGIPFSLHFFSRAFPSSRPLSRPVSFLPAHLFVRLFFNRAFHPSDHLSASLSLCSASFLPGNLSVWHPFSWAFPQPDFLCARISFAKHSFCPAFLTSSFLSALLLFCQQAASPILQTPAHRERTFGTVRFPLNFSRRNSCCRRRKFIDFNPFYARIFILRRRHCVSPKVISIPARAAVSSQLFG